MADQLAIPGEFCSFMIGGVEVAATRNFNFNVDRNSYGNFVARGTSKWRRVYPSDMGASIDFDGLLVLAATSPAAVQFDDLFTQLITGTAVACVFTLKTNVPGDPVFIYTASGYIKSLKASAPNLGEGTFSGTYEITGAVTQTTDIVS